MRIKSFLKLFLSVVIAVSFAANTAYAQDNRPEPTSFLTRTIKRLAPLFLMASYSWANPDNESCSAYNTDANKNLIEALQYRLGVNITTQGNSFSFCCDAQEKDCEQKLQEANEYFSDPDAIRKDFIPISSLHESVNPKKDPCKNTLDFLTALGVDPDEFQSINLGNLTDTDHKIVLPYRSRFDKRTVSNFEDTLKDSSPFIEWLLKNEPGFRTVTNDSYIFYSFEVVDYYLCGLPDDLQPKQDNFTSGQFELPIDWVIKHMIAPASSEISLNETSPGNFAINTLQTAQKNLPGASTLSFSIYVDRSGSMDGKPIQFVDQELPRLLDTVQSKLQEGELSVSVYSFNDQLYSPQIFTISPLKKAPRLTPLTARGETDLRFIGKGLELIGDMPGLVVAFTDGDHSNLNTLPSHYQDMEILRDAGNFAYPVTAFVGSGKVPEYLEKISRVFSGETFQSNDIEKFFEAITGKVNELLVPRKAIVFSLDGAGGVFWRELGQSMVTTNQTVSNGGTVTYNGLTYTVNRL